MKLHNGRFFRAIIIASLCINIAGSLHAGTKQQYIGWQTQFEQQLNEASQVGASLAKADVAAQENLTAQLLAAYNSALNTFQTIQSNYLGDKRLPNFRPTLTKLGINDGYIATNKAKLEELLNLITSSKKQPGDAQQARAQAPDQKAAIEELENNLKAALTQIDQSNNQRNQAQAQLAQADAAQQATARQSAADQAALNAVHEKALADLQAQLAQAQRAQPTKEQKEAQEKALADLQAQLAAAQQQAADMQKQIQAQEKLQATLTQAQADLAKANKDLEAKNAQLAQQKDVAAQLQKAQADLAQAQQTAKSSQDQIIQLQAQLKDMQKLQNDLKTAQEQAAQLTQANQKLQTQVADQEKLRGQLADTTTRANSAEQSAKENALAAAQAQALRNELKKSKDDNNEQAQLSNADKKNIEGLKEQVKGLTQQLATANKALQDRPTDKQLKELEDKLELCQAHLNAREGDVTRLDTLRKEEGNLNLKLEKENEALNKVISELHSKIQELEPSF